MGMNESLNHLGKCNLDLHCFSNYHAGGGTVLSLAIGTFERFASFRFAHSKIWPALLEHRFEFNQIVSGRLELPNYNNYLQTF